MPDAEKNREQGQPVVKDFMSKCRYPLGDGRYGGEAPEQGVAI